jgi:uncharacterized RDD family membrane protein YckC
MSSSCPKCGWPQVEGARCPRCGVEVARYRADIAAAAPVAPGAAPGVTPRAAAPVAPGAEPVPSAAARPAGFWIRALAVLIDGAVVMTAETVLGLFLWTVADDRLLAATSRAFRLVVGSGYFVLLHWLRGQTIGKMAVSVRVISLEGGPLSFGQAVLRYFGTWISACLLGLGYLLAGVRADKRALHDLIASTRVEHVT